MLFSQDNLEKTNFDSKGQEALLANQFKFKSL